MALERICVSVCSSGCALCHALARPPRSLPRCRRLWAEFFFGSLLAVKCSGDYGSAGDTGFVCCDENHKPLACTSVLFLSFVRATGCVLRVKTIIGCARYKWICERALVVHRWLVFVKFKAKEEKKSGQLELFARRMPLIYGSVWRIFTRNNFDRISIMQFDCCSFSFFYSFFFFFFFLFFFCFFSFCFWAPTNNQKNTRSVPRKSLARANTHCTECPLEKTKRLKALGDSLTFTYGRCPRFRGTLIPYPSWMYVCASAARWINDQQYLCGDMLCDWLPRIRSNM